MSDYAPLYTTRDRKRLALLMAASAAVVAAFTHFWMVPAIEEYWRYANGCFYDRFSGFELVFYGMCCGAPLSPGLLLLSGPRSYRIVKSGQDPLPGEKTLRKRRYRYGYKAMLTPVVTQLLVLYTIGVAICGAPRAAALAARAQACSAQQLLELKRKSMPGG